MAKSRHQKRRDKSPPKRKRVICKREKKNRKNGGAKYVGGKQQWLRLKTQSPGDRAKSAQNSEITPEVIVDTLKKLSKWRDPIPFYMILKYIKVYYSVNPDLTELEIELSRKLYVAEKAGIVKGDADDNWRVCTSLERLRNIPDTFVSLFWQLHCDAINPLASKIKRDPPIHKKVQKKEDSDSDLPSD